MNIFLKVSANGTEKTVSLNDLCELLGIHNAQVQEVSLNVEKNGASLKSTIVPEDAYPGFTVDGEAQGVPYYLASVELPNEDYPLAFTARLYAGRSDDETDCPIALVQSGVYQDALPDGMQDSAKLVYIDEDFAKATPWGGSWSSQMPEHSQPDRQWVAYGVEDSVFLSSLQGFLDCGCTKYEFWSVVETDDGYGAKHGVIDLNEMSDEDIQKALSAAGYQNMDMFVQENSPIVIPVKTDGSLDESSDEYCIDYTLLASLVAAVADDSHLVPGFHWANKDDAIAFFCGHFDID